MNLQNSGQIIKDFRQASETPLRMNAQNRHLFLISTLIGLLLGCGHRSGTLNCNLSEISLLSDDIKVDSKIMITNDSAIVFSANTSQAYRFYMAKNGLVKPIGSLGENVFSPFYFDGSIEGLKDVAGDNEFQPTASDLKKFTKGKSLELIYTFNHGKFIIYKLKENKEIFYIDLSANKSDVLVTINEKLHGVVFSDSLDLLVLSYDASLISFNTKTSQLIEFDLPLGQKLNPYFYKNYVYFSNNSTSEYFQIFQINVSSPKSEALLIWQSSHDLRRPKRQDDNYLYFIEIISGEYQLRRLDLRNSNVLNLTSEGVVYDYDFLKGSKIIFTYSDLHLPKSLMSLDLKNHSVAKLYGDTITHDVKMQFIRREEHKSSAYLLESQGNTTHKGVILYLRPGIREDFSPRYDPVLMNLCINGYYIIAPNYPTSSGYGKSYLNATQLDALEDIRWWMEMAKGKFKLPVYCLAVSGSNIVFEQFLVENGNDITSAASLFGTYLSKVPNLSVPTLYVLGERDPIVDFQQRLKMLTDAQTESPIKIVNYSSEGHLFRKKENENDMIRKLIQHFCAE